jgi:hypothetical protein
MNDEPNKPDFTRHTIVGRASPDGTRIGVEVIAYRRGGGRLKITPLQGTDRRLPLTPEAARTWVDTLIGDRSDEDRDSLVAILSDLGEALVGSFDERPEAPPSTELVGSCSFCGKSAIDVRRLIANQDAGICDECITVCSKMLADDQSSEHG